MLSITAVLDQLQRYLSDTSAGRVRPPVECKDGFKMSVQTGMYHYCSPQNDVGPWTAVEVGFPSKIEPILWEYAEEPGKWTDTVYPNVPIDVVAAVIEVHGGFAEFRCKVPAE
jgi:hypothetical protein